MKGGAEEDVGAPHILKIEQDDGNPPRLVARQIKLTHTSSIGGHSATPEIKDNSTHSPNQDPTVKTPTA